MTDPSSSEDLRKRIEQRCHDLYHFPAPPWGWGRNEERTAGWMDGISYAVDVIVEELRATHDE